MSKKEIKDVASGVLTFAEVGVHTLAIAKIANRGCDETTKKALEKAHVGVALVGLTALVVEAVCKK